MERPQGFSGSYNIVALRLEEPTTPPEGILVTEYLVIVSKQLQDLQKELPDFQ